MKKVTFALWSLAARWDGKHNGCPYCQSILHSTLQKRMWVMEARKCHFCGLIFRWPVTTDAEAAQFYQEDYQSGIVTDLPSPEELQSLRANDFRESRFDKRFQIDWIRRYCPAPARVLNFGSSWGYTDFQIQSAGYEVEGLEVSVPRAQFGREKLGLKIHTSWEELRRASSTTFDLIFSSHTLEHVTNLWSIFDHFSDVVTPGGHLLVIVPNGGGQEARTRGVRWSPFVGKEHTIAFTPDWFRSNLSQRGWDLREVLSTTPEGKYDASCNGDGLMCIARYRPDEVRSS